MRVGDFQLSKSPTEFLRHNSVFWFLIEVSCSRLPFHLHNQDLRPASLIRSVLAFHLPSIGLYRSSDLAIYQEKWRHNTLKNKYESYSCE